MKYSNVFFKDFTNYKFSNFKRLLVTALVVTITFFSCFLVNQNIEQSKLFPQNTSISLDPKKKMPASIEFAEIIKNKSKHPSLLNYGVLDIGIYNQGNFLPSSKYFSLNNISKDKFPELSENQIQQIKQKKIEFIVMKSPDPNAQFPKFILKNYKIIATHSQQYEGNNATYYLFEKYG